MNTRSTGPLSPVSVGASSEWSGLDRYNNDNDSLYSPNPISRSQLVSPPISIGAMNNGRFPPRDPGAPSPPASIARSSTGTNNLYTTSESGRNKRDEQFEGILSEHYLSLKKYLAASSRDKSNPRPNKAQDKLLRLSAVQFQELSTDVFDELLRRQASARREPNGAASDTPAYLLPEKNFHPKRNQARQKLSSLPPPRFRDLATDVFYELERRFPRFAAGDISRMNSPASTRAPPSRPGTGTPGTPGTPGLDGRPSSRRRPSDSASIASYGVRSESRGPVSRDFSNPPAMPPNGYGRPTPKTFQQNTIVPNKSTMVEDDDEGGEEDNEDAFNLERSAMDVSRKDSVDSEPAGSETDKKLIADYQSQVAELREKMDALEDRLREKDTELSNVLNGERTQSTALSLQKKEWDDLRINLESKLADAQALNDDLRQELDRVRAESSSTERELRSQVEELQESSREMAAQADQLRANGSSGNSKNGDNSTRDAELERENRELRRELDEQQEITEEVRKEAQEFLKEMRVLSEQGGASWQRQEMLEEQVNRLEQEVKDWRNRYARTKTQLRSMRASSIGLTIQQDPMKSAGFTEDNGLVKDVHVTKFQISIDELLDVARKDNPDRVTEFMKNVVANVRQITQDIEENGHDLTGHQTKLKSKVSATTNNLITASKNFAVAGGISPVSLLDAAASHLTTAVVELLRTVRIRPTPAGELEDDDDRSLQPPDGPAIGGGGFFFPLGRARKENGINGTGGSVQPYMRMSTESSMYSPINSPRQSTASGRPKSSGKEGWRVSSMRANGNNPLPTRMAFGIRQQSSEVEDLKIYLEDQTAILVQTIQSLVSAIRSEASLPTLSTQITAIATVVSKITLSTNKTMQETKNAELRTQATPVLKRLEEGRERLLRAGEAGEEAGEEGLRTWAGGLPPIAFEIARETKELVQRVDGVDVGEGEGEEDFS